jgi:hypothetical protein
MGFFTVRRKRITSGARITTVIATYMNRSPKARWRRDLHDMRLDIGIVGGRVALTLAIEVIADTHAGEQKQQHEEAQGAAYSTARRRGCRRSGGRCGSGGLGLWAGVAHGAPHLLYKRRWPTPFSRLPASRRSSCRSNRRWSRRNYLRMSSCSGWRWNHATA